ncbi:MAG TPA: class I SAM-dependent methyltransferase [Elusimicrobiota bacterium]|jgi:SAM-dependent methyltransferase|nr:class I SAM-dependent methyltransferase [Elusimicrobiota bacterium]
MDELQRKSAEEFARRMKLPLDTAASAGRHSRDAGKEERILEDICAKLLPGAKQAVLDIGCGAGGLTPALLARLRSLDCAVCLVDIPEVLAKLGEAPWGKETPALRHCPGIFPEPETLARLGERRFDRILAYSVLHYTSRPADFVAAAASLLAPGGRLLLGDLPNVDKKGRFLSSPAGRAFEAAYKGVPVSEVPEFRHPSEYVRSPYNTQNPAICDGFLLETAQDIRAQGLNAYLLPQPPGLPFSMTREDLLITREP